MSDGQDTALLRTIEEALGGLGWPTELYERSAQLPVTMLVVSAPGSGERTWAVTYACVPADEDELPNTRLLQLYAPLDAALQPERLHDVRELLLAINLSLPLGHFTLKDGVEVGLRHMQALPSGREPASNELTELSALFLSLLELYAGHIETVASGTATLDTVLESLAGGAAIELPQVRGATGEPMLEAVKRFLTEQEWHYEPLVSGAALRAVVYGDNGSFNCFFQTREEERQLICYATSPTATPAHRRAQMAEFVTRANYGLFVGNFEMDYSDGEVRFKTSVAIEDQQLTPALIRQVISPAVILLDQYQPGIQAVAEGSSDALEAIEMVEE
ncbi:MAG: hypothetical protein RLZZ387_5058 [Chloroflexota bacterium]